MLDELKYFQLVCAEWSVFVFRSVDVHERVFSAVDVVCGALYHHAVVIYC